LTVTPADSKLRWFQRSGAVLARLLPESSRRFLRNRLFAITPNVPLFDLSDRALPLHALKTGIGLGLVFCLGGTALVTWMSGTLYGSAPGRLFFLDDRTNIANYLVICPAYVGLASAFIVLVLQAWGRLRRGSLVQLEEARVPRLPFSVFVFLVVGASAALTTRYILECLDPAIYQRAAWYVNIDSTGHRYLNTAGVFYTLLNFSLLLLTLVAFASLSLFGCVAAEAGRALRSRAPSQELRFEQLQADLREFTLAYVAAKVLAATYILNAYTWKWEDPRGSLNLILMTSFLAVFGVVIVSFPRYYVELEWFHFKVRSAEALGQAVPRDSDDLRDKWIRDVALIVDTFFGISFVTSILA
jgi:hypothetical protein